MNFLESRSVVEDFRSPAVDSRGFQSFRLDDNSKLALRASPRAGGRRPKPSTKRDGRSIRRRWSLTGKVPTQRGRSRRWPKRATLAASGPAALECATTTSRGSFIRSETGIEALATLREAIDAARRPDHCVSLYCTVCLAGCTLALWIGDLTQTQVYLDMTVNSFADDRWRVCWVLMLRLRRSGGPVGRVLPGTAAGFAYICEDIGARLTAYDFSTAA